MDTAVASDRSEKPDASAPWKRLDAWLNPINGLIALLVSVGAGAGYAYRHVLTTTDSLTRIEAAHGQLVLRVARLDDEASCALAMEAEVSRRAIDVSRRVREALRSMQEARDFDGLKVEIRASVATMDKALEELELAREQRISKTLALKGSERCKA